MNLEKYTDEKYTRFFQLLEMIKSVNKDIEISKKENNLKDLKKHECLKKEITLEIIKVLKRFKINARLKDAA